MNTEVRIRLVAREAADGRIYLDPYEYDGRYHLKNGKHFILYQEKDAEGKTQSSVIRIDPDKVAVLRSEKLGGHMVFDPRHPQKVHYQSEFGEIVYYLTTIGLEKQVEAHEIVLRMDYSLQIVFSEDEAPDPARQDMRRSMEIRITERKES